MSSKKKKSSPENDFPHPVSRSRSLVSAWVLDLVLVFWSFNLGLGPGPVGFIFSCLVLSCLVFSCRVVSCRVVSCLALSFILFSFPFLSCLVLSCLVLSCLALPCLVLSCLVVPSSGLSSLLPSLPRSHTEASSHYVTCVTFLPLSLSHSYRVSVL
jgi:hypothetical protein